MANWIMINYKLVNLNLVKGISHSENSITFEFASGQKLYFLITQQMLNVSLKN